MQASLIDNYLKENPAKNMNSAQSATVKSYLKAGLFDSSSSDQSDDEDYGRSSRPKVEKGNEEESDNERDSQKGSDPSQENKSDEEEMQDFQESLIKPEPQGSKTRQKFDYSFDSSLSEQNGDEEIDQVVTPQPDLQQNEKSRTNHDSYEDFYTELDQDKSGKMKERLVSQNLTNNMELKDLSESQYSVNTDIQVVEAVNNHFDQRNSEQNYTIVAQNQSIVPQPKKLYSSLQPKMPTSNDLAKLLNSFKPRTEMTFGDFALEIKTPQDKTQIQTALLMSQDSRAESINTESYCLSASQFSKAATPHSVKPNQINSQKQPATSLIKLIIYRLLREQTSYQAFQRWRHTSTNENYKLKLQNASQMVDKMSKFSRRFISLNTLEQVLKRNKIKKISKAIRIWSLKNISATEKPQPTNELVHQLQRHIAEQQLEIQQKNERLETTENMFKEYQSWRGKLELIEQRMRNEVEHWKTAAGKLQSENTALQKEALKMSRDLMERVKQAKLKDEQIQKLQTACNTVEEAICQKCSNSLEESFYHSNSAKKEPPKAQTDIEFASLNAKIVQLEKQLLTYKDRVSYHQSIEEEHRKNLEQQVDVLLKMEEERLTLLKEHQQSQESLQRLETVNNELQQTNAKLISIKEEKETEITRLSQQIKFSEQANIVAIAEKDQLIEKYAKQEQKRKSLASTVQKKQTLKFKPEKAAETAQMSTQQPVFSKDQNLLSQELVTLNREFQTLKIEHRHQSEQLVKIQRQLQDAQKSIQNKDVTLDKLRRERDDLSALVSQDQFKSIRSVESQMIETEQSAKNLKVQKKKIQDELSQTNAKCTELTSQVQAMQLECQRLREYNSASEALIKTMEERQRRFEQENDLTVQEQQNIQNEAVQLRSENIQLKKDLGWLANQAQFSKNQAEKAIVDLQAYNQILRGMERKLAEIETQKEFVEKELQQTSQSYNSLLQKHNWAVQQQQQKSIGGVPQASTMMWQETPPQPQKPPAKFYQDN